MAFTQFQMLEALNFKNPGRSLLVLSLLMLSVGLPLSPFLVGASQFFLLLSWFIEGDFKNKWLRLKSNRALHAFLILPLLHFLWLFNTSDYTYALHDIKIKLPLLVFPLLLGTAKPITKKELDLILAVFILAVFSGTMVTMSILTGIYPYNYTDIREASIFISHIRFGLMIVFVLVVLGKFIAEALHLNKKNMALALSALFIWMLFFLIILQSVTSWVILFFLVFFLFFFYYKQITKAYLKIAGWLVLIMLVVGTSTLLGVLIYNFYFKKTIAFNELPNKTPRGNLYLNDTTTRTKENGHYVRVLISYKELGQTWPSLSQIPFNGKDANGYSIWATMIRYLTSKGLPKDQDGLMALEPEDIRMIEKGYASCVYRSKFIPYIKAYSILWELDRYFKSGDANNKSVAQRIEYLKAAGHLISKHFWFGVGTGDLNKDYKKAFAEIDTRLHPENQHRAHNQYLTFFVAFGLFGFMLSLSSMFFPLIWHGNKHNLMLISFIFITFLSMINEDTLETQAGVSFYIFFYTLLLFSSSNKK
ncbi:MAG: O-antigen ligase family protein [Salinivirgaceae bacterium]